MLEYSIETDYNWDVEIKSTIFKHTINNMSIIINNPKHKLSDWQKLLQAANEKRLYHLYMSFKKNEGYFSLEIVGKYIRFKFVNNAFTNIFDVRIKECLNAFEALISDIKNGKYKIDDCT